MHGKYDHPKLDAVFGGVNSATALAINRLATDKRRVYFNVSSGASRLANEDCSPYAVHYSYDTTSLARGTVGTVVKGAGKSWYFLTADYVFGKSLEDESGAMVKDSGGTVLGSARHPLNASDFSSFLIQARTSNAKVLGIDSAGGDAINALKSAHEFGMSGSMRMVGLALTISDIHAVGLDVTQGLVMTDHWYWNANDQTRAFAKRFFALRKRMPTSLQAANYSAVRTYLKAVETAGTDNPDKVMATLKSMKIDDLYNKGYIRKDGRFVHDMYVFEAKRPSESATPWDYLSLIRIVPEEEAFQLPAQPKCALLKNQKRKPADLGQKLLRGLGGPRRGSDVCAVSARLRLRGPGRSGVHAVGASARGPQRHCTLRRHARRAPVLRPLPATGIHRR